MSCFTFTWHESLTLLVFSSLDRCPTSVGRTSPPPSHTVHLHLAQVPPPTHANGRHLLYIASVDKSVEPAGAINGLSVSPLTTILTSPDCTSFDCANRRIKTSISITNENAITDVTIVKDTES